MRLEQVKAIPHPGGNRIDVTWANPPPTEYPYVRVVRCEGAFPMSPTDGMRVPQFSLSVDTQNELNNKRPSAELQQQFAIHKAPLSGKASITTIFAGSQWRIEDGEQQYVICKRKDERLLDVYNERLPFATDQPLRGEVSYYYMLFPWRMVDGAQDYQEDVNNRVAAMATSPYNMAGQLYDQLPAIYHRYDAALLNPVIGVVAAAYLFSVELDFVGELDAAGQVSTRLHKQFQKYNEALAPQARIEVEQVGSRWTIVSADKKYLMQRENETLNVYAISNKGQLRRFLELPGEQFDQLYSLARALLDLYDIDKVDGYLLPLLAEWIGWQTNYQLGFATQRNELRYAPAIYQTIGIIPTVEATVKRILGWECRTKEFVHNIFRTNTPECLNLWMRQRNDSGQWSEPTAPLSLDAAYEGRPAAVQDPIGTTWLFYHTLHNDRWEIRYKTLRADGVWSPSQPLVKRGEIDKHPTAAIQGKTLWVFWNVFEPVQKTWRIDYCTTTAIDDSAPIGAVWSAIKTLCLPVSNPDNPQPQRKRPCAFVDNAEPAGLWLFWLEATETGWQLKYNRHDGTQWLPENAIVFPDNDHIEDDLFICVQPDKAQIWVFWSCQEIIQEPTNKTNQARWRIHYRVKTNLELDEQGWSKVHSLPELPESTHDRDDREPAVLVDEHGNLEMFWSSNREGNWSIWRGILGVNADEHTWNPPVESITRNPYSQRTPLPLKYDRDTLLIYRSNESVIYRSKIYGATETFDARYAGCTTFDARNVAKKALRGEYADFQTYLYNTAKSTVAGQRAALRDDSKQTGKRTEIVPAAPNVVGIYLKPTTDDPTTIVRNRNLIEDVLRQFLPIQVRLLFIIEPTLYTEKIYDDQHRLEEAVSAELFTSITVETYPGLAESRDDDAPDWIWLRTWSQNYPDHHTLDTKLMPVNLKQRIWHTSVKAGG